MPEEFGEKVITEKEFTPKRVIFNVDTTFTKEELEKKKGAKCSNYKSCNIYISNKPNRYICRNWCYYGWFRAKGDVFDGSVPVTKTITIGQDVSPTANVQFNSMTSNQLVFGNPTTWFHNGVSGSLGVTGSGMLQKI